MTSSGRRRISLFFQVIWFHIFPLNIPRVHRFFISTAIVLLQASRMSPHRNRPAVLSPTLLYSQSNMEPTGSSPHVSIPRQKMHKHACDSTVEQPALSSGAVSHPYPLGLETQALPAATLTCLSVGYCLRSPWGTMYYEFRLSLTFLKAQTSELQNTTG